METTTTSDQPAPSANEATGANAPASKQDQADNPSAQEAPETFTRDYVEQLRKENARYRTEAKEAKRGQDSSKSELQQMADRVAELEQRAATAERTALVADVASTHGISVEDAAMFLTAPDRDGLVAQAKRVAELSGSRAASGPIVKREGAIPTNLNVSDERAAVRQLFGTP